MAGEESTAFKPLDIVSQEQELTACDVTAAQLHIKNSHPGISGLFTDDDLLQLTYAHKHVRFDFRSKIIQVLNTDYTCNGNHWITVAKDPGKLFQIYDSQNVNILTYIPYEVQVKLLSFSKIHERYLNIEGRGLNLLKIYQSVSPPHCTQCEKKIKPNHVEVFLCCLCWNVYHETCMPLAFYQNWPVCQQCNIEEQQKTKPNENVNTQLPEITQDKPRYLDSLGEQYFVDLSMADADGTTSKMFNVGIGTKQQEHSYLLHFKQKQGPVLLYDLRYTHHHTVYHYSLPHDIEVALVHLSWPHIVECQQIEILPSIQQDPQSNDCGVYACLSAANWAAGYTADLMHGKSGQQLRQILQDYVNGGILPSILPTISLDLTCKATLCLYNDSRQASEYGDEVDMYKCYFCKNWYHHHCFPAYDPYCSIYRTSCDDCRNIWEHVKQESIASKGTAQVDSPPPSETHATGTSDMPSSDIAPTEDSRPTVTANFFATNWDDTDEIDNAETSERSNVDQSLLDDNDTRAVETESIDMASVPMLKDEASELITYKPAARGGIMKETESLLHTDTDRNLNTEEPDISDGWENIQYKSHLSKSKRRCRKRKCHIL